MSDRLTLELPSCYKAVIARSMAPSVKDKILNRPRAIELAQWRPSELTIEDVRRKLGGPGVSDEELLLRWVVGREEVENLRATGFEPKDWNANHPVVALVEALSKRTDSRHIRIQKQGLSLKLERRLS
jgi:oxaloacetate decarboxylase (Na+ extruding) subunit alpha